MKTASYFTYTGPGRIGISIGAPRRCPAGYRLYRTLAPRRDMLSMALEPYRRIYFDEILGKLDPEKVNRDLHSLAVSHEPVLLCFERPPFTEQNFCHRRMVAEWLEKHLGVEVPEIGDQESLI